MDITFLGTSAGTPTRARNVTALALQVGHSRHWYLIDCGEGTQHQLLRSRHSVMQLQAIFITHVHGDHTLGLPGLLTSASMSGRQTPLAIIGPPQLRTFIETTLRCTDSSLGFELTFINSEADDFQWQDGAIQVTSHPLSHRVPCHAFRFVETNLERQLLTARLEAAGIPAGPDWGLLQRGHDIEGSDGTVLYADDFTEVRRQPRCIVVAGDNDTPQLLHQACQGAQVLVHESTYTQEISDRVGPWPQHSSAQSVAQFAQAAGLPNLILTHFSSRYQFGHNKGPSIGEIETEASAHYHGNLHLARDHAHYRLERDLTLTEKAE